jgi:hypothetical protein
MEQRRRWITMMMVAGGVLLAAAAVLLIVLTRTVGPASPLDDRAVETTLAALEAAGITPPPSMVELAETYPEIAQILNDPELGTVYKELMIAYQEGGTPAATELAQARGLLTPDGKQIRVALILDTEDHEPLVAQLRQIGVDVVSAYKDRVNVGVALTLIEEAAQSEDAGAIFARLTELDHVIAVRLPEQRTGDQQSIEGEGIGAINAAAWHAAGYTGEGLRIGVLDLGFASYEELLGRELPADVEIAAFGWYDQNEVHGTACAEIVHDIAPEAELFLAWYDGGDPAMGEAVDWLRQQGVHIITHSANGVFSPRDGSGWDARLVDDLTAAGVLWINSAGNDADLHYRGVFRDGDGDGFHDFETGDGLLPIYAYDGVTVYLTWQEPWENPTQDYELLLLNGSGDTLAISEEPQDGSPGQNPGEALYYAASDEVVYVAIEAYDADRPVTFDLFALGPDVEVGSPVAAYSVGAPGDAAGSLTVGAVNLDDNLAYYSSQGPTNDERMKPDISAPTGVSGASYGNRGFDGTSASAPHVAGAAALVWQAYPTYTRADVADFLLQAARDLGPGGPDTGYGYGNLTLPQPPAAAAAPPPAVPPAGDPVAGASTPIPNTPVPYVTPIPAPPGETGRAGSGLGLLFALVVGAMGLGGTGLLVIGGLLLIVTRSRPRPQPAQRPRMAPPVGQPPYGQPGAPPPAPARQDRGPAPAAQGRCPTCGIALRPEARFCPNCGEPLEPRPNVCRNCGAPLNENSRFCGQCGQPV